MNKKTNTRLIVAAISLAVLGTLAAPQASAHKRHKKHRHVARSYSSYSQSGSEVNSKVDALEAQLRAMQDEISSLRAAGGAGAAASADAAKVQELDAWMQDTKAKPAHEKYDNDIFFRGGFASNDGMRNGVSIKSEVVPVGRQDQADKDAWYIGAGFDFGLTDDVWGLVDNTEVLAELMFEYKEFGNAKGNCLAQNPTCLAAPGKARNVTVNQFTLTAAPKIKFMKGSDFRPWIIPIGLGLHVVSPPSESITVLNPGMMFGAGADYRLWKDIFIGADARYHLTGGAADGVNTDGFTAGGYLGIGF